MAVYFFAPVPTYWLVTRYGTPVEATIDGKDERTTGRSHTEVYYLHYSFPLAGQTLAAEQKVPPQTFSLTPIGTKVHAKALMIGPWPASEAELEGQHSFASSLITSSVPAIVVVILASSMIIARRRTRWLIRSGNAASGLIVARRSGAGRSRSFYITYGFRTASGAETTRDYSVTRKSYDLAYVGSPVTVLYDANRPKRSLPYEYCGFEIIQP